MVPDCQHITDVSVIIVSLPVKQNCQTLSERRSEQIADWPVQKSKYIPSSDQRLVRQRQKQKSLVQCYDSSAESLWPVVVGRLLPASRFVFLFCFLSAVPRCCRVPRDSNQPLTRNSSLLLVGYQPRPNANEPPLNRQSARATKLRI